MLSPPTLPSGMRYEERFLTVDEEAALLASVRDVTFSTFEMHGVAARRRVAFYGQTYDASLPGAAFPDFLLALRVRMAGWAGAAVEQRPDLAEPARAWTKTREAQLDAGELAVTVHHEDLLAVPR